MLLRSEIDSFFTKYQIPLAGEVRDTERAELLLLLANQEYGYSFASFILHAVVNADRDGIQTNFSSADDLYECYGEFMTGFVMYKSGRNN